MWRCVHVTVVPSQTRRARRISLRWSLRWLWAVQCGAVSSGPLKEQYALLIPELSLLHPDLKGKESQEGVWWVRRSRVTGSTLARRPSWEFLTFVLSHNLPAEKKEGRRREEKRTHGRARICTLPRKSLSITQELGLPS